MCDDVSIERCNELTANSDVTPVNESYEIFSTLVKRNMNDMLPVKLITINGDRKTHRNKAKPRWSQNLTDLWKLRCDCEKLFCESNFDNRAIRREQFVNSQKSFDQAVRTAKKGYWYQQQAELLVINQKSDFWKRFGQIGIIQSKKKDIPWEISRSDGTVSENQHEVLCHWKCAFEKLLNPECGTFQIHGMSGPDRISIDTLSLDTEIIVDEVRYALHRAGKGNAIGDDGIPMEVLDNNQCIYVLVTLFNTCFSSGTIPEIWPRGIISPIIKDTRKIIEIPLTTEELQ